MNEDIEQELSKYELKVSMGGSEGYFIGIKKWVHNE